VFLNIEILKLKIKKSQVIKKPLPQVKNKSGITAFLDTQMIHSRSGS